MSKKFNLDALNEIPIDEVIEALGGRYPRDHKPGRSKFNMHCFGPSHSHGDRNPSLFVNRETNFCKCFVCGDAVQGGPVALAKRIKGGFKEGCEWLHDAFGVPCLDEPKGAARPRRVAPPKRREPKVDYWRFHADVPFKHLEVRDLVKVYKRLDEYDRLRTVYTFVYRFSLTTDQAPKRAYHASRGIEKPHPAETRCGYLSGKDIDKLSKLLEKYFPLEDLVKLKLFNDASSEYRPFEWKHRAKGGLVVVPFQDLYGDTVHGLKFRKVDYKGKNKEPEASCRSLVPTVPFGLNRELLESDAVPLVTEGYIDGLSSGKTFIAVPGVNGVSEEVLGLLEGRRVIIAFDQDKAGQEGAKKLRTAIIRAGGRAEILTWDPALGKDLNEVLQNGNLDKVL